MTSSPQPTARTDAASATPITVREAMARLSGHHHDLIDALPQSVWISSPEGTLLHVNRFWLDYTGMTLEQALDPAARLNSVHPDDAARLVQDWKQHLAEGREWRFEYRLWRAADGEYRWHDARYLPVHDEDGRLFAWLGIAFDIEDARRTRLRHALLSAMVESSDDAIVTKTLDGIVTSWNHGAERLFGYTAAEMVGRHISVLLPNPERRSEVQHILDRLRAGERIDHFETQRRRKDGRIVDVSLTISPVRDDSGEVVGASSIKRDITDRKRLERTLRESEERFRALADSAPSLIWTTDAAGEPEYFNRRWNEYAGLAEGEPFAGSRWLDLVDPDDLDRVVEAWRHSIRNGETFALEYRVRPHGSRHFRWHLARAVPLRDDAGAIRHWVGTCTDIDDQKRAEQQLREHAIVLRQQVAERTAELLDRNDQLVTFSYSVSHDLRAPLRAIRGYLDAMLDEIGDGATEEARGYARRIAAATERMDLLIRELLAYGRTSVAELAPEPTSLEDAVGVALQQLEADLSARDATVEVSLGELPLVSAQPRVLTQVVFNLVANAIKFVAPDVRPRVRITAEVAAGTVRLDVADNGIGIEPRHQERIFQVFEQLQPGLYSGSGVGLAMVRRAVERMGGRVALESEPGRGSRFTVELRTAGIGAD